nr:Chain B, MTP-1 [synthetic construct]
YIRLYDYHNC